eukprot:TRINITY_DN1628_c0_g2_i1.p1 TRINITY_DN1628_c0_g2~~TRINITY_DN1628_c0_g2_i1.p1  ORF type:complete len:176 (+),score=67.04 TRINITY_DN1628_c0_g2_i1:24-551(+)
MNKLFSVIVLLGLASTVLGGCLSPLATAEKRELSSCQWYNDNTCCTDGDVPKRDELKENDGCAEPKEGCVDQAFLLSCGLSCSPDFSDYIDGTSIKLCKKFADKLYGSCKDSDFKSSNDGSCKKFKDEYSSGKDFTEKGLGGIYVDGDSGCFNAAGLTQPLIALVIAAVAVFRFF